MPKKHAAPTSTPSDTQRMAWVDVARGVCVLAVVVLHACVYLSLMGSPSGALAAWGLVCGFGTAVRIPLLLFVSGFLVSSAVGRGWRHRQNWLRVADVLYLYVLWVVVTALLSPLTSPLDDGSAGVLETLQRVLLPNDYLWYVYALALWTVVMTLLRSLDQRLVLAVLAVLTVTMAPDPGQAVSTFTVLEGVLATGTFFALGVMMRPRLHEVVRLVTWPRVLVCVAVLCVLQAAARVLGGVPGDVAHLGLTVTGIVSGVGVVVLLVRHLPRAFSAGLAVVGRHTLPIYLLHMPLLGLVFALPGAAAVLSGPVVVLGAPIALAATVAATAVLLRDLLQRSGATWLFALPAGLRARIV